MTIKPTGEQFTIAHGRYEATITEVGATLRSLRVDGDELLWTFGEDESPSACNGWQLAPWPNRIRDGRYTFDEVEYQLDISEVPRNTALHGLAQSVPSEVESQSDAAVTLRAIIYPTNGWAGVLEVSIQHCLDDDGLRVAVTAENVGGNRLPYGYGAHPYVAADLATAELHLPHAKELLVDERLLPKSISVVTPEHDFREPHALDDTTFDSAFQGDGAWEASLTTEGRTVTMWADDTLPWIQVFTTPKRDAIAIEPMTCGPDAFNEGPTHNGVIVLEPGESTTSVWGIRAS